MRPPSTSNNVTAPPWLEEQVYGPKRQRTYALVQQSVDALRHEGQRVSLAAVATRSRQLDAHGKGVSESAILGNADARAYYERYRTWKGSKKTRAVPWQKPGRVEVHVLGTRDESRVRQRYFHLSKAELVERLLTIERAYGEQEERWLQANDELLYWRLQAEALEQEQRGVTPS